MDVGCGNDGYAWMPKATVSADKFYEQVANLQRAVVADIESLPFRAGSFDLSFCVGSVINYASALEAISELARVTAKGGHLYLHFETSTSFEQLGRPSWNAQVHLNKTENSFRTDHVWIYAPRFITTILSKAGFRVIAKERFHILSALLVRLGADPNRATQACRFDKIVKWLSGFADNVILLAERT